jgi:hypothetical protein
MGRRRVRDFKCAFRRWSGLYFSVWVTEINEYEAARGNAAGSRSGHGRGGVGCGAPALCVFVLRPDFQLQPALLHRMLCEGVIHSQSRPVPHLLTMLRRHSVGICCMLGGGRNRSEHEVPGIFQPVKLITTNSKNFYLNSIINEAIRGHQNNCIKTGI